MTTPTGYENYRLWKGWDSLFKPRPSEVKLFDREFSGIQVVGKSFLDIGFGRGGLIGWARSRGANVAGLEIQEELLQEARKCDILAWQSLEDVPAESFEIITLFDVLEHIPASAITDYLSQVRRIARPAALIIIRVPNCQSPFGLINQMGDPTHCTMLSGPIVSAFGEAAGLRTEGISNGIDERRFVPGIKGKIRFILQELTRRLIEFSWGASAMPCAPNVVVRFSVPVGDTQTNKM